MDNKDPFSDSPRPDTQPYAKENAIQRTEETVIPAIFNFSGELGNKIKQLKKSKLKQGHIVHLSEFTEDTIKFDPLGILVIDDEESIRAALKRILEREGYSVMLASDASEVEAILSEKPVSLIFLDIGLPWINGYELCKLLKEEKLTKHIPVVFISGLTDDEAVKKGFAVGGIDYLKKPFSVEEVVEVTKALLSRTVMPAHC